MCICGQLFGCGFATLRFNGHAVDRPPPAIGAAGLLDANVAGRARAESDVERPVIVLVPGDLLPLLPVGR